MHDDTTTGSWGKAFAALPQEVPPARGWERMSARLDRQRRNRVPAWVALATAAALVLSLTLLEQRDPRSISPVEPSHARLAQVPATAKPSMARLYKGPEATDIANADAPTIAASAAPTTTNAPAPVEPSHARLAQAPATTKPSMARLYTLYAESAQLETLLAAARDDRVSSAGAALLGDELETRVAVIDASLSQPGLDDGARVRLWQARVDALRQAAGFESTQRLLASQGRSDMMLVSVD